MPSCPFCGAQMEKISRPGRVSRKVGTYWFCARRCSLKDHRAFSHPLCQHCEKPMNHHVGKHTREWLGVSVWWCPDHRYSKPSVSNGNKTRNIRGLSQKKKPAGRKARPVAPRKLRHSQSGWKLPPSPDHVTRRQPAPERPLGDRSVPPGRM